MMRQRPPLYVRLRRQAGVTLIELIMFIMIVSIALIAVMQVFGISTARSADPLVQKQALTIAEAMMDEILSKSFQNATADPDIAGSVDDPNNSSSTDGCTPTTTPACPANAANRSNYNDVLDFNGWTGTAKQPDGTPINTTRTYTVSVTVADGAALGDITARKVTVTVTAGSDTVTLTGYRTNYDFF